jgi:hypothetical protein
VVEFGAALLAGKDEEGANALVLESVADEAE